MKILIVHNDYGKYSGEEAVVDKMVQMLTQMGHQVNQLRMSTASARESLTGKIRGFIAGIYSPSGIRAMRKALAKYQPDVVNVHNLFPFISPAALRECQKAKVPVVMTVHNFRLICPTGLFMRNGKPCTLCLQQGNEWSCIKHNCEHSHLKSVGYAARNAVARRGKHYQQCVDRFACITNFQRQRLTQAGFDPAKLLLIPNSMDLPPEQEQLPSPTGSYVAYAGRLSSEKGIDMIIEVARRHPEIPFRLAGECREPHLINNLPPNLQLTGHLNPQQLAEFYRNSRFLVMASRWYEGFPMTILEAAKFSKCMIAPNHGGFTEIIGSNNQRIGELFAPGNIDELEQRITDLWHNPNLSAQLGQQARTKLKTEYSTEVIAQKWQTLLTSLLTP